MGGGQGPQVPGPPPMQANPRKHMTPAEKLNVLFIIRPHREAGADMVLLNAAARLNRDRFKVICGLLTREPGQESLIPPDAEVIDFHMPALTGAIWLRFFFHLCWVLYRRRVQIIHVNSYIPGNYARLAAILLRVPVIVDHWHGFTRFSRKRKMICRLLGRCTDLSLAVSRRVRDYLLEQCRLDPDRVRVVANGIDSSRFEKMRPREEMRRELGLPPDVPVLGLVARLEHWGKGHRELFMALALLRRAPFAGSHHRRRPAPGRDGATGLRPRPLPGRAFPRPPGGYPGPPSRPGPLRPPQP